MTAPSAPTARAFARPGFRIPRPGLRAGVLGGSALVVVALSVTIAVLVSEQLRTAAADAALDYVRAIVRGYVDTVLTEDDLGIAAEPRDELSGELGLLVQGGDLARINIWTRDGRVIYSTDAAIQGQRLGIDHELAEAFAGRTPREFGARDASAADAALPERYLEVYVPIRGSSDGTPIGVFEVYVDAGPIETRVTGTQRLVFLTSMAAGALLLGTLALAFAGTSRRLRTQNERLTSLNEQLGVMADDLRRREARFRSLVQNSSDVVTLVGGDGKISYESDAVRGVLGRDPSARVGRAWVDDVHPNDAELAASMLDGLLGTPGGHGSLEVRLQHANGTWRWAEIVGQNRLDEPAVGALVLNYRDITDRKALEAQLQHDAFHDPLTGLANRALFIDRVGHALARSRKGQEPAAVLFVDLDDFKVVNDSLGHASGDELLGAVAERLRACLRRQDTAARLGGDEFAVLLEDTDPATAEEIADRILDALRQPFAVAGRQLFTQASIGIAVGTRGTQRDPETADDLLRNADAAMYTAKARGKGRHQLYQPAMHAAALRRLELRERLEAAMAAGEFEVHFQPVVQLATSTTVGAEALVRWRSGGRLLPPAEFLEVAEESGLIVPLGRWVLRTACAEAARWPVRPRAAMSVAVNVSSRQLADPAFPDDVRSILDETGLPAGRLVVEVTESALLDEGPATSAAIATLKSLGVRVALDDFGTGYSSLSHLRRFPIDVLKINRSFVEGIDGDRRDERALVRSIVRLAHSLRIEIVAEGIERPTQLDVLRTFGAQLGQGFLFDRPADAPTFAARLRRPSVLAS